MKENLMKYWKVVVGVIVAIIGIIIIYQAGSYVYRNSYDTQKYEYVSKGFQGEGLDENVSIVKKFKRNNKNGKLTLKFDKKQLNEEYDFTLGSEVDASFVEVGVEGKIGKGAMNVKLFTQNNESLFDRTVEGAEIKEVSTPPTTSKSFKLLVNSYNAYDGDVTIYFNFK